MSCYPCSQPTDFQVSFDWRNVSYGLDSSGKPRRPARQIDFKLKYKTEMCKGWVKGLCEFGDKCAFAHGHEELREKTANVCNYKTKRCKQFFELGVCMYGTRCQFLHTDSNTATSTPESSARPSRKSSGDEGTNRLPVFLAISARGEKDGYN